MNISDLGRVETEYGHALDCDKNGCEPRHRDHGTVFSWTDRHERYPKVYPLPVPDNYVINNHATTLVQRTVTYTAWEPVE